MIRIYDSEGSMVSPYPHYQDRSAAQARESDEAYDRQLAAARASFPERRIIEVHGGLVAVPADVELVTATTVDSLVAKLRKLD